MDSNTTFTFQLLYIRVNGLQYQGSRLGKSTANQDLQALSKVPASAGTRTAVFYSGFIVPEISWLPSFMNPHIYKCFW